MKTQVNPTPDAGRQVPAKSWMPRLLRPFLLALDLARAERDGLMVLFVALGLFIWVPIWTEKHRLHRDQAFWASLPIATQRWMDSIEAEHSTPAPKALVPFDPNTASVAELVGLGLAPALAKRLDRYRAAGGHFRDAEALLDLYGFPQADYERLRPFVRIASEPHSSTASSTARQAPSMGQGSGSAPNSARRTQTDRDTEYASSRTDRQSTTVRQAVDPADPSTWRPYDGPVLDINQADVANLDALPGIGESLAKRALRFRERLGGFVSVEQFREIYGLDPAVYDHIEPHLRCTGLVQRLRLNASPEDSLRAHPYIAPWIAERIVDYREEHGGFMTLDELQRIRGVTDSVFGRLRPYMDLGSWQPD